MTLTKEQRAILKEKFGGHCSYCGIVLKARWQADHLIPILRQTRYVNDEHSRPMRDDNGKHVIETYIKHPEHDVIENMMPSCQKCNNDKSTWSLEEWRIVIVKRVETLNTSPKYASYQKAKRFNLVEETNNPVVFWFETYNKDTQ